MISSYKLCSLYGCSSNVKFSFPLVLFYFFPPSSVSKFPTGNHIFSWKSFSNLCFNCNLNDFSSFSKGIRCKSNHLQEKKEEELPQNQRTSPGISKLSRKNERVSYSSYLMGDLFFALFTISGINKVEDYRYPRCWQTRRHWKSFNSS